MQIYSYICSLPLKAVLLLCALFSFLMLATALIGQYGFDLHPCDLCIYQRIPYAGIVAIGTLSAIFIKSKKWQYTAAILCALLFLLDAAIAGYHTGVELKIFKGPDACSNNSDGVQTIEEIRAAIMSAPLITCEQAMVYVYGLSMAAWNMIAAIVAFFATSFILLRNRKIET